MSEREREKERESMMDESTQKSRVNRTAEGSVDRETEQCRSRNELRRIV